MQRRGLKPWLSLATAGSEEVLRTYSSAPGACAMPERSRLSAVARSLVMGVLNVTPDSFFDGGRYFDADAAIAHGRALIAEGADIVDIGGESSRPGAVPVLAEEELRRVLPVVEALSMDVRVSIDTVKPEVALAAVAVGASLINDVGGSLGPVASSTGVGLVVMHRQGTPADMQINPQYGDVVSEVTNWLDEAAQLARKSGVDEVYVDPGIGFGKTVAHNLALLKALPKLVAKGEPVLVGVSRKSFLGRIAVPGKDLAANERFEASLASATYAMAAGAAIVRAHDVAATRAAAEIVGRLS